jgi:hypothetical protein
MNVKKSLENHIRGWFPQEPKLRKSPANLDSRIKPQPIVPSQMGKGTVRVAKNIGLVNVFSIIIFILFFSQFNVESGWKIVGLVSGIVFGLIGGAWAAPRVIKRTENHKDSLGWKEYLGVTVPAVIFVLLLNQVSFEFSLFASFTLWITFWFVHMVLFLSFEKKKKVFMLQDGWFGVVYSIVPKASKNNSVTFPESNPQEVSEKLIPDNKSWMLLLSVGTFVIVIPAISLWLSSYANFFSSGEGTFIILFSFSIGVLFALLFSVHYRNQSKKTDPGL